MRDASSWDGQTNTEKISPYSSVTEGSSVFILIISLMKKEAFKLFGH